MACVSVRSVVALVLRWWRRVDQSGRRGLARSMASAKIGCGESLAGVLLRVGLRFSCCCCNSSEFRGPFGGASLEGAAPLCADDALWLVDRLSKPVAHCVLP